MQYYWTLNVILNMRYGNIREAEIINHIKDDWFGNFDCTAIIKDIDFSVKLIRENDAFIFDDEYLLWAEAKKGSEDTHIMLAQLILTIGKARTFDKIMPPKFLGAFDSEKIVFVPYFEMQDIFYLNDFNWNVAPSNHETREFQLIKDKIETVLNGAPQQTFL
ncbi:MAG: hypothetical protein LBR36_03305, partial [Bacteroidales bacterium]|nr:hypothetical protein [Bacteroidales bacterium]